MSAASLYPRTNPPQSVRIAGVDIDCVDVAATLAQIEWWLAAPLPSPCRQICTVNPEFIVDARRQPAFAAALARADLRVPDGVGILWAARRRGVTLAERVTGSDGIYHISAAAARHGWSLYFLGAQPGIADATAERLSGLYPGLRVAGSHSGSPAAIDWGEIQARLARAQPDILLVAFGHPRQDLWIDAHRTELPARVAIGVGGAFDFVAGVAKRAPERLQHLQLEWLHRLVQEPWRWRRMLKLPLFVSLVLREELE